jgi:hypothetical protein
MTKEKKHTNISSDTKNIGVDRKTAKPHPVKKDFKEIIDITFKRHEKSFEKLAE